MKIVLDYDPSTGMISDPKGGGMSYTWNGLEANELRPEEGSFTPEELIKLRNAGYTTDDLVELRKREML